MSGYWNTCPRCEAVIDIRGTFGAGQLVGCACGANLKVEYSRPTGPLGSHGRWSLVELLLPSGVTGVTGERGRVDRRPLANLFDDISPDGARTMDVEWVAAAVCSALARGGDRWRAVHIEELLPLMATAGCIRDGTIDPLIGRMRLEDAGYLVTDIGGRTTTPTQQLIDVLAGRFA